MKKIEKLKSPKWASKGKRFSEQEDFDHLIEEINKFGKKINEIIIVVNDLDEYVSALSDHILRR